MVALKTLPGLYQCPPPDRQSLSRQPDFYGNTIHNSETAVQYAGHFALRLANLGFSASPAKQTRVQEFAGAASDAALTAEGRQITWRGLAPSGASRVRGRRHHQGVDHQRLKPC